LLGEAKGDLQYEHHLGLVSGQDRSRDYIAPNDKGKEEGCRWYPITGDGRVWIEESRVGGFEHVDRTLKLGQRPAARTNKPGTWESHRATSNRRCFWVVMITCVLLVCLDKKNSRVPRGPGNLKHALFPSVSAGKKSTKQLSGCHPLAPCPWRSNCLIPQA
jgi:hypothetical protein